MRRSGMTLAWFVLGLVLTLAACAPYASAPTGGGRVDLCTWVRARVLDNTMPLELAVRYYPECAPFTDRP